MNVIGIDYSITSPAICIYEGEAQNFAFKSCQLYSLCNHDILSRCNWHIYRHTDNYEHDTERFNQIANWAIECISRHVRQPQESLVGIEDYSMGSKGKVFNIAENCGALKTLLWQHDYPIKTVAPTVVKKFATGKGNATKDKMLEQFETDTGIKLKEILQPKRMLGSPTTDLVDAYYICKYFVKSDVTVPNQKN
jgi:Holliday junction resolvasome RuvABC endonuclease subunit